jgi:hypothetical protein
MRVERLGEDLFHFRGGAYDSGSLAVLDGRRVRLVDGLASVEDARAILRILVEDWGGRVVLFVASPFFSDHMAAGNLFPEAERLADADAVQTFRSEH